MAKRKPKTRDTVSDGDFSEATDGLSGNRVFVSMSKTINTGNYESVRLEFGVGRTVDDGEKFDKVLDVCKTDACKALLEMTDIVEENIK